MKTTDIEGWEYAVNTINEANICTKNHKGTGICVGDSGSGLVYNNTLLGIVSWSIGCADGNPCVHARVFPHLEWINEQWEKAEAEAFQDNFV